MQSTADHGIVGNVLVDSTTELVYLQNTTLPMLSRLLQYTLSTDVYEANATNEGHSKLHSTLMLPSLGNDKV